MRANWLTTRSKKPSAKGSSQASPRAHPMFGAIPSYGEHLLTQVETDHAVGAFCQIGACPSDHAGPASHVQHTRKESV